MMRTTVGRAAGQHLERGARCALARLILAAALTAAAAPAAGQQPDLLPPSGAGGEPAPQGFSRTEKAFFELHLDRSAYAPGETAQIAAVVHIEDGWHLQSHQPTYDYLIPTELSVAVPPGWRLNEVRYPPHQMWHAGFADEELAVYEGTVTIRTAVGVPADAAVGTEVDLVATLEYQACDDRVCLRPVETQARARVRVAEDGEAVAPEVFADDVTAGPAAGAAAERPGLLAILGLALLGGLILNAMPCVLPVLSLKVFGLVKEAGQSRRRVVTGAMATALGILVSFWALAAAAVAARSAGEAVGWGIQFQNPGFVAFLTVVVVFFSLNLWGLFEIPLPAALGGVGGRHEGLAGHFSAGLFATLMATPCSAPFLGSAVGFALSQPAGATVLVFTFVGLGMAAPYLVLAAAPAAARALPRPGPWMEVLKGVMGFLLAGAAVWLLYVLAAQIAPHRLAFFEGALLLLALFAWLKRRATAGQRSGLLPGVGMAVAAVLAIGLAATADPSLARDEGGGRIAWQRFDEAEAVRLAAQDDRLVFVDVTADWCATCKINERAVLESDEVVAAFERLDVVPMQADWTSRDDVIADYLARHGRYAIPFYVLYRPGQAPHVFGELLTRGTVLSVLEESAPARPVQTAAER